MNILRAVFLCAATLLCAAAFWCPILAGFGFAGDKPFVGYWAGVIATYVGMQMFKLMFERYFGGDRP